MELPTAKQLLKAIADAIITSVAAAGPMGCPSGTIYAALMTQGCTLEQYEAIMAGLVQAGMLTKKSHLYFVAGK